MPTMPVFLRKWAESCKEGLWADGISGKGRFGVENGLVF